MQMIELQTSIDNLKTAYKNLLQNAYYKDTKHIDTYTITNQQEELNELFNSWYNIILKTTDENEKEEKMQDLKKIVDMLIEYMNQENQNASVLHENMKRIINYLRIFIE